jgi:anti-sigma B factor antagonist
VPDLTVHASSDGDSCVLSLGGELDLASTDEVSEQAKALLATGRCRVLVIDLSGLTFIDSTGLGLFVELRLLAADSGATIELANVPPGPARIIGIVGLAETFGLEPGDEPTVG